MKHAGRVTLKMMHPQLRFAGLLFRVLSHNAVATKVTLPGARKRSTYIARPDGSELRLIVKRPAEQTGDMSERLPGMLWIHGGGYCTGMPEMICVGMARVAAKRCVTVAPDYTLSCEKPFPDAFDDCCTALVWMVEHAEQLGIRADQIFVGGESAGGGLTVAVCLWARDSGRVNVACQLPLYPMLDDQACGESMRGNDAPVWSERKNRQAWARYLDGLVEVPSYASPARELNCAGLPPAITFVGDIEPFRDEVLEYVEKLKAANVPVHFKMFEGCYHSFDIIAPGSKPAKQARAFFTDALEYAIREYFAEN